MLRKIGKFFLKLLIWIIQIPLTIIYFALSFCGGLIAGIGWLFGVIVFGVTVILLVFGQFDNWVQIAVAFGVATAIVILPGWLTDFIGEGILFLKDILAEITND